MAGGVAVLSLQSHLTMEGNKHFAFEVTNHKEPGRELSGDWPRQRFQFSLIPCSQYLGLAWGVFLAKQERKSQSGSGLGALSPRRSLPPAEVLTPCTAGGCAATAHRSCKELKSRCARVWLGVPEHAVLLSELVIAVWLMNLTGLVAWVSGAGQLI